LKPGKRLRKRHTITNKNTANPYGQAVFGEAILLLLFGFQLGLFSRRLCLVTLDTQQLQFEYQYRIRRNQRARALLAIGQVTGDVQLVLLANVHQLQTFDPTLNHATNRQIDGVATLDRAVENSAVNQTAFIVNGDNILNRRLRAIGFLDHFVLQAGFGGDYAIALGIVLKELRTGSNCFLVHSLHALFRTRLQEGEGLHQLLIGQLLLLLVQSVVDTPRNSRRVEIIHSFLDQALAHIQTDTVGRLLRWRVQLDARSAGIAVATRQDQAHQGNRWGQTLISHAFSLITLKGDVAKNSRRAYQPVAIAGYSAARRP